MKFLPMHHLPNIAPGMARMRMARAIACASFLVLSAADARAQVVYSGVKNVPIPADFDGVYIDLDTATTSTSEISGWDINLFFGGYAIANSATFQPVRAGTTVNSLVLNLTPGTVVDGSLQYASAAAGSEGHIGSGPTQFQAGTEGYLGFKFSPAGGGGPYFGWMRVNLNVNTSGAYVRDWAYNNTGAAISVMAVPEPAATGIAGVLGLVIFASVRIWRARDTAGNGT